MRGLVDLHTCVVVRVSVFVQKERHHSAAISIVVVVRHWDSFRAYCELTLNGINLELQDVGPNGVGPIDVCTNGMASDKLRQSSIWTLATKDTAEGISRLTSSGRHTSIDRVVSVLRIPIARIGREYCFFSVEKPFNVIDGAMIPKVHI